MEDESGDRLQLPVLFVSGRRAGHSPAAARVGMQRLAEEIATAASSTNSPA